MFETSWQDLVLLVGNLVFLIALIPSIMGTNKPSLWTSLFTALTMSIFAFTYYSLGLKFGIITVALSALAWWVLFFQKIRN